MNQDTFTKIVLPALCGGIGGFFVLWGGIAMTLVGISSSPLPVHMVGYCLGTVLFMAMGCVLAAVSREPVLIKALAIGMSLPGFLRANIQSDPGSAPKPDQHVEINLLVGAAYAQPVARKLTIGGDVVLSNFQLWFVDPSGALTQVPIPSQNGTEPSVVTVPDSAVAFAAKGPEGWSATENLPVGPSDFNAVISGRSAAVQGFFQAVGGYSGPYEIDLR